MNDTGTKITTSENVVAMTARPMSAVAARAASNGRIRFSSMKRKMFSRMTMASSMTTPTMSTSASIVTLLSVNPSARIIAKVVTSEAGMATAAITVEAQFRRGEARARRLDRLHRVGAGRAAHLEEHRGRAVQAGDGALLLDAVLRPPEAADPHGDAAARGHDQLVQGLRVGAAPQG